MNIDELARHDFEHALRRAFWRQIISSLTGKSNELLPFEEVRKRLPLRGQRYLGLQSVPLSKIVGSESRYRDFDRAFLPRQTHTRDRWINIDKAHYRDIHLPPVELYKVGDVYFVRDGNHRVSVARERGQEFIDAYVTEIDVPVPIGPDMEFQDIVLRAEYAAFLEATSLDRLRPGVSIELTIPGQYEKLLEHIAAHRWFMGERRGQAVPYEEAVISWYDNVYLPLVRVIREQHILEEFPGRTEADLYLWIIEHQWYLRRAFGDVSMEEAARQFAEKYSRRPLRRFVNRLKQTAQKVTGNHESRRNSEQQSGGTE
ncbi:MAG: hypothetical protein Q9O62_13745 [Ardenticatenia bacterium]|nr:hypothetical protein [Ardenticatenia bacterium]